MVEGVRGSGHGWGGVGGILRHGEVLRRGELGQGGPGGPDCVDFGRGKRAFVQKESVFPRLFCPSREDEFPGAWRIFFREVMKSKRISGDEAVVSSVPRGGMAEVGGMVEDGDAHDLFIDWGLVVDPGGFGAPEGASCESLAISRSADRKRVFAFDVPFGASPDGHGSFFSIAEGDLAMGCFDGDFVVDEVGERPTGPGGDGAAADDRRVGADDAAVGGLPMVGQLDHGTTGWVDGRAGRAGGDDLSGVFRFLPEIDSIHVSMSKPQRLMVGMVLVIAGGICFHGPVASEWDATGAVDRPENWFGECIVSNFGQDCAIDEDGDFFGCLIVSGAHGGLRRAGG